VLILYDPVQTAMGNVTVRAYKQVTDDLEGEGLTSALLLLL